MNAPILLFLLCISVTFSFLCCSSAYPFFLSAFFSFFFFTCQSLQNLTAIHILTVWPLSPHQSLAFHQASLQNPFITVVYNQWVNKDSYQRNDKKAPVCTNLASLKWTCWVRDGDICCDTMSVKEWTPQWDGSQCQFRSWHHSTMTTPANQSGGATWGGGCRWLCRGVRTQKLAQWDLPLGKFAPCFLGQHMLCAIQLFGASQDIKTTYT